MRSTIITFKFFSLILFLSSCLGGGGGGGGNKAASGPENGSANTQMESYNSDPNYLFLSTYQFGKKYQFSQNSFSLSGSCRNIKSEDLFIKVSGVNIPIDDNQCSVKGTFSTLITLKNNLSLIEVIWIQNNQRRANSFTALLQNSDDSTLPGGGTTSLFSIPSLSSPLIIDENSTLNLSGICSTDIQSITIQSTQSSLFSVTNSCSSNQQFFLRNKEPLTPGNYTITLVPSVTRNALANITFTIAVRSPIEVLTFDDTFQNNQIITGEDPYVSLFGSCPKKTANLKLFHQNAPLTFKEFNCQTSNYWLSNSIKLIAGNNDFILNAKYENGSSENIYLSLEKTPYTDTTPGGGGNPTNPDLQVITFNNSPTSSLQAFSLYEYTPAISNPAGDAVTFSLSPIPEWITFNSNTGKISGIPFYSQITPPMTLTATSPKARGTLSNIRISVSGDPLAQNAWHLINTGQKNYATKGGTPGKDINIKDVFSRSIQGQGVRIAVIDEEVDTTHEDLMGNLLNNEHRNYLYFSDQNSSGWRNPYDAMASSHGTSVTGLIAAEAFNGIGLTGIAPLSKVAVFNFMNSNVNRTTAVMQDHISVPGFDIFNQSWGINFSTDKRPFNIDATYRTLMRNAAIDNNTVIVRSAGNNFEINIPSIADPNNNTPFTLNTAALDAYGKVSSYSSAGSNLWIATPGGSKTESGEPTIISTDISSCDYGKAKSTATSSFDKGLTSTNSNCDYTSKFNGTSAAAPIASGVVALIKSANPNLNWREIKHILATTAKPPVYVKRTPNGYINPPAGIDANPSPATNKAGYTFHNDFGFGTIDAKAAVDMAESWNSNEFDSAMVNFSLSSQSDYLIPNNSSQGVTYNLSTSHDITIESVHLQLTINHPFHGDLGIKVISPQGTSSWILPINNGFTNSGDHRYELITNAFYKEKSVGAWKIIVYDGAGGNDGGVTTYCKLTVYGH